MDTKNDDERETQPRISTVDGGTFSAFPPAPPGSTVTTADAAGVRTEVVPESVPHVFASGEIALLATHVSMPDGTKHKGHTLVRVLSIAGAQCKVSLGRGLSTLAPSAMLELAPDDLPSRLAVGDVILPEAKPSP